MSDFCRLCSVVFLVDRLYSTTLESDQNVRFERRIPIGGINEIAHMSHLANTNDFNKLLPIHKYRLMGKFPITDFHRLAMPGQIMQFITNFVSDS